MNCVACSEKFTRLKDLFRHLTKKFHAFEDSRFFCIPCSLPLAKMSIVIEHMEGDKHSIMTLATGIRFDAEDESHESFTAPFPPLKFCLLCSCRGTNPFHAHMNSSTHRNTTSVFNAIIGIKNVHRSNWHADKKTQEFIRKLINIKQRQESIGSAHISEMFRDPLPLVCELCNIYFNNPESYKHHLENQSHKRVEQFLIKIAHLVKEIDIVYDVPCTEVSETFSNTLPPLYYCGLCCIWVQHTPSYVQHIQSTIHRRIEELSGKLSNKRNGDAVSLLRFAKDSHFNRSNNYCKLCTVWIPTSANVRDHYYKDIGHRRIDNFVNSLPDFEDKKFIKVYVEAQALIKLNNSLPPNYCELCNILHCEPEEYKQHLESEEHKHVEQNYRSASGEKASKMLKTSISSLHQHFYPNREVRAANKAAETTSSFEENGSNDNSASKEHYCELCEFSWYNVLHYDKHLIGVEHKKMRRLLSKKEKKVCLDTQECETSSNAHPLQYNCELCDVFSTSYHQYEEHLDSAKHKRNQWMLYVLKQKCL